MKGRAALDPTRIVKGDDWIRRMISVCAVAPGLVVVPGAEGQTHSR